ncbi:hypothetical protein BV394_12435 [Brevirhabdus pacifica]|uniref:Uncharacterized protein n=1 Tax=Brevirhabdus pacifica TaxID=1267768 RepID=A0A1U7DKI1_9RHOB|nr:phage holin family protein [Brevirhabdus pacifica]APX90435.1 hypothetical protein BV394_12435 [Brevirhabdus pacifica]OWU78545.1 hypothetical protein ATO5_07030 [Loktanella sp. 22II-4b]PJJ85467.1 putative superfamily III holin-X [Brevirhabdus pacifica]
MQPNSPKSTSSLVSDALYHVSGLVRKEIDLAKAEVKSRLSSMGTAIGLIVAGAIVALVALNVLAAALVAALTEAGLDGGWAALIVGVGLALIAFFAAMKGVNDLKNTNLTPRRTVRNVKRDTQVLKETYHGA